MEYITEKLSNGNIIEYQIVNGTAYHKETSPEVVRVLEMARGTHTRLRLYFGDVNTGRDWGEVCDTVGYIGRSTGSIKVPILVYNDRSSGGGAILDHCIVKITHANSKIHGSLYEHPNYHLKIQDDIPTVPGSGEATKDKNYIHSLLSNVSLIFNKAMSTVREWFDPGIIPLQSIK